jgi:hypothetical protein
MRPVRQSFSAGGAEIGDPIPIDQYLNPTNIGLSVDLDATATYTVEHTFDDVFDEAFNPATAVWFPHPTLVGQSANADGNYAFPPTACRLNIAANTGVVNFNVIQAGAVS